MPVWLLAMRRRHTHGRRLPKKSASARRNRAVSSQVQGMLVPLYRLLGIWEVLLGDAAFLSHIEGSADYERQMRKRAGRRLPVVPERDARIPPSGADAERQQHGGHRCESAILERQANGEAEVLEQAHRTSLLVSKRHEGIDLRGSAGRHV